MSTEHYDPFELQTAFLSEPDIRQSIDIQNWDTSAAWERDTTATAVNNTKKNRVVFRKTSEAVHITAVTRFSNDIRSVTAFYPSGTTHNTAYAISSEQKQYVEDKMKQEFLSTYPANLGLGNSKYDTPVKELLFTPLPQLDFKLDKVPLKDLSSEAKKQLKQDVTMFRLDKFTAFAQKKGVANFLSTSEEIQQLLSDTGKFMNNMTVGKNEKENIRKVVEEFKQAVKLRNPNVFLSDTDLASLTPPSLIVPPPAPVVAPPVSAPAPAPIPAPVVVPTPAPAPAPVFVHTPAPAPLSSAYASARSMDDAYRMAITTMDNAYRAILGIHYPFRRMDLQKTILEGMKGAPWTAVIVGTRFLNSNQRPYVHTYIYSPSEVIREQVSQWKVACDNVLPVTFIGREHQDNAAEQIYNAFRSSHRLPTKEHDIAQILGKLHVGLRPTAWTHLEDPVAYFCIDDECDDPCQANTVEIFEIKNLFVTSHAYKLVMDNAFGYFATTMLTSTSPPNIDAKAVETKWRMPLWENGVNVNDADVVDTSKKHQTLYKTSVLQVLTTVSGVVHTLLPDNQKEKPCVPLLYCAKSSLQEQIKCLHDEFEPMANLEICDVLKLRSRYLMVTNRLLEFYTVLQETKDRVDVAFVGEAYCKITSKLIPWYHQQSQLLESMFQGIQIMEHCQQQKSCAFRTVHIPSTYVSHKRLKASLSLRVPELVGNPSDMLAYLRSNPSAPEGLEIREYLTLDFHHRVVRAMAEHGVNRHEVYEAEGIVSDLLQHAHSAEAAEYIFSRFEKSFFLPEPLLLRRRVQQQKSHEDAIRAKCQDLRKRTREAMNQFLEIMLHVGMHTVVEDMLTKTPPMLDKSQGVVCSSLRSNRCGDRVASKVMSTLSVMNA